MHYLSTRSAAGDGAGHDAATPGPGFDDVLLAGLAPDGGLYVPASWPAFDLAALRALPPPSYGDLAARVLAPFMTGSAALPGLDALTARAYERFRGDPVPLRDLGDGLYLLELFQGPTLAFKDYALQILGLLFDRVLAARDQRITIVGATSGDTGSAAIEACRGKDRIDIYILHPRGRVSEVQRRQMTTVADANVHNIAIDGTFDDCQDLVKALFADPAFRAEANLSAVNSINWARIAAQSVYYVSAALRLPESPNGPVFSVPTGNFGNVYAGYVARAMGIPVSSFVVASNRNDILTRFFDTGRMEARPVEPSLSPSMDIQVSSNFERLLFELCARHGGVVRRLMADFRETGQMALSMAQMIAVRSLFQGFRLDDDGTLDTIRAEHARSGVLLDPHSAIAVAAARRARRDPDTPVVALATAHPAKFPDAVERATGIRPALPGFLADLFSREERMTGLANDLAALKARIRATGRRFGNG